MLHAIQMAKLFPDGKTFVDMSLKENPGKYYLMLIPITFILLQICSRTTWCTQFEQLINNDKHHFIKTIFDSS